MKRWALLALSSTWTILLLGLFASLMTLAAGTGSQRALADGNVYVDTRNAGFEDGSPDHPWSSIEEGIAAVPFGQRVLIADGAYSETLVIDRPLALDGGYAPYDSPTKWTRDVSHYETWLDGGGSGPVVTIDCACTATLSGLTIAGGRASQGGGLFIQGASVSIEQLRIIGNEAFGAEPSGRGGGIYLEDASLSISATTIVSNSASQAGGGLFVLRGWAEITDTEISANTAANLAGLGAGGGISVESGALALTHSSVLSNTADCCGGGVGARYSHLLIDANVISHNSVDTTSYYGGGVYAAGSHGALRGNTIRSNCALLAGGVAVGDKSFHVTNNLIESNVGGGLLLQSGTITNNTMRNNLCNSYGEHGYGLLLSAPAAPSFVTVTNNIISGNALGISSPVSGLSISLAHNDVWGNALADYIGIAPGETDISVDPSFQLPGPFGYRLMSGSPCIDGGTNDGAPLSDIEENPRPQDGNGDGTAIADIGAYERVGQATVTPAANATASPISAFLPFAFKLAGGGTPTPSPPPTLTPAPSATSSATPSPTPTEVATIPPAPSGTPTLTATPTVTSTSTPTGASTFAPTDTTSVTPTSTATPADAPSPTATTSATPPTTPTATPTVTWTPNTAPPAMSP